MSNVVNFGDYEKHSYEITNSTDLDKIKSVLGVIWSDISEHGAVLDEFTLKEDDVWLGVIVDGNCIGFVQLTAWNGTTLEIHSNILPDYRQLYTEGANFFIMKWILDYVELRFEKLVAFVPEDSVNVISFALKHGWKHEGCITQSYHKDGKLMDLHVLGITFEQITKYLEENEKWQREQQ